MSQETRTHPTLTQFNPFLVPYQAKVIRLIDEYDYDSGSVEILCSGSVGSAKTILGAHLAIRHCLMNPGARVAICRRSLPDLKATIFQTILEHMEDPALEEGTNYFVQNVRGNIRFENGSEIVPIYWADKRYKRARSMELSAAVFEELTENNAEDEAAFREIKARIGRRKHVREKWILALTNPDSPRHWAYKYFIQNQGPSRYVFYSRTEDNPFLPPSYIEQLKRDLDPKQARRMVYGEWVEIDEERLYYSYSDANYLKETLYQLKPGLPIDVSFDFNIGVGKPMSACVGQYDPTRDEFHYFAEYVIHGARTLSVLEEMHARGLFNFGLKIRIFGDATGKARSTNALHSNYEIIQNFLANYRTASGGQVSFEMCVPRDNPPIRERHNTVNAYCENAAGKRRLFVYQGCKTIDEGMRLTALKKGAEVVEDDSKPYQHVTTALGYHVVYVSRNKHAKPMGSIAR